MGGRVSQLGSIKAFQGLDAVDLAYLSTICAPAIYTANQFVYRTGEIADSVFFVTGGSLVARAYGTDGKEVNFFYFEQGDMFGLADTLMGIKRLEAVETRTKASLVSFTRENFEHAVREHPSIGLDVMDVQAVRYRSMQDRIFEYSTLSVKVRIRAELLRIIDRQSQINGYKSSKSLDLSPAPSHYEIAARTSTHREAVSREFAQLAAAGILEAGRKEIRILDMPRLISLVQEDINLAADAG